MVLPGHITTSTKQTKHRTTPRNHANVFGNRLELCRLQLCLQVPSKLNRSPIENPGSRMKYPDGQKVKLRDKVKLGQDESGVVVCSIDDDEYSDDYPKDQWGYLKKGVMIYFPSYGLIHYEEPESDLQLIARRKKKESKKGIKDTQSKSKTPINQEQSKSKTPINQESEIKDTHKSKPNRFLIKENPK